MYLFPKSYTFIPIRYILNTHLNSMSKLQRYCVTRY